MRLTNEHREDMTRMALNATFKRRDDQLLKMRTALADALYEHAFGEAEKLAKKLPLGWLACHRNIEISCDGFKTKYAGPKEAHLQTSALHTSKDRLFPLNIGKAFFVGADHQLWQQAQEAVQEHASIVQAKEELRATLHGVLHSCFTLKQLQEAWPEGKRFFPKEVPKRTALVPVDLTVKLNSIMQLTAA